MKKAAFYTVIFCMAINLVYADEHVSDNGNSVFLWDLFNGYKKRETKDLVFNSIFFGSSSYSISDYIFKNRHSSNTNQIDFNLLGLVVVAAYSAYLFSDIFLMMPQQREIYRSMQEQQIERERFFRK